MDTWNWKVDYILPTLSRTPINNWFLAKQFVQPKKMNFDRATEQLRSLLSNLCLSAGEQDGRWFFDISQHTHYFSLLSTHGNNFSRRKVLIMKSFSNSWGYSFRDSWLAVIYHPNYHARVTEVMNTIQLYYLFRLSIQDRQIGRVESSSCKKVRGAILCLNYDHNFHVFEQEKLKILQRTLNKKPFL